MSTIRKTPQTEQISRRQAWWLAIRPQTLPAAVSPVIVGWSIAAQQGAFLLLPALAALTCALLLQITSNLANDVMDFSRGADTSSREGFQRATQSGLLSSREVWGGTLVTIGLTIAAGSYLIWLRGFWVLLIGLLSIIFALAYSAGPFPLSYHGLGGIFVLIFFGLAGVCGTVYVMMGEIPLISWVLAGSIGMLITAILVVNNIRDVESDRAAGRKNVPVSLGLKAAYLEYRILLGIPYLAVMLTAAADRAPALLLPVLSLPAAVKLMIAIRHKTGADLNPMLSRTAQLTLWFSVLLAGGMVLS